VSQWNARAVCGAQLASVSPPGLPLDELLPKSTPADVPQRYGWVAGMPLNQSGPPGWCETFGDPNYNAQVEFEPLASDFLKTSGANSFASSGACLRNARMRYSVYDGDTQPAGMEGYRHFVSWIKSRMIAGDVVSIGVFSQDDDDELYDHEVTVLRIGTNHDVYDVTYCATRPVLQLARPLI